MKQRRWLGWLFLAAGLAGAVVLAALVHWLARPGEVLYVTGAVLRDAPDPGKQRPITGARITVVSQGVSGDATSDTAGFFNLRLNPSLRRGTGVALAFRHPDYRPLSIMLPATEEIRVVRMTALKPEAPPQKPEIAIANVRLRYAVRGISTVDVGSAVRVFEVPNTPNVPCNGRPPCSPDGKWKASLGSVTLDAGPDKEFRNVRLSCTAGPCPFTKIDADNFSRGGRVIRVSVLNWSDNVTYLLEAEVAQTISNDEVRRSYPVIFGRAMNFTMPPPAQGPSIEAEVGGTDIVFPLGPKLNLSWATCRMETGADRTRLYRCELKPQYYFK